MKNDRVSNEDILRQVAEIAIEQDEADSLDIEPDEKILAIAREYDRKKKQQSMKKWLSIMSKIAAVFVIGVIFSMSTVDSSHHISRHAGFIVEEQPEGGSAYFKSEKQILGYYPDMNMWYPTYLPGDFELTIMEDDVSDIFMLFESDGGNCQIRMTISYSGNVSFSHDTESTTIKEFEMKKCSGYMTFGDYGQRTSAFWIDGDEFIEIEVEPGVSESEMLKIIEGMELRK